MVPGEQEQVGPTVWAGEGLVLGDFRGWR